MLTKIISWHRNTLGRLYRQESFHFIYACSWNCFSLWNENKVCNSIQEKAKSFKIFVAIKKKKESHSLYVLYFRLFRIRLVCFKPCFARLSRGFFSRSGFLYWYISPFCNGPSELKNLPVTGPCSKHLLKFIKKTTDRYLW